MWAWLLQLIPGVFTTINGITSAISNEKIAALNATSVQDQIAATERVNTLQAQRDVLIADSSHSSIDMWMRTAIAFGPMVILNKIFIYDKVLGLGSTPIGNSDYIWNVIMVVVGFYFLHSVASIFK